MQPIHTVHNTKPAYQLNWTVALFWRDPAPPEPEWLTNLRFATEKDGVRILNHRLRSETMTQFLVSTTPATRPSALLRSIKGRLQYLVRAQRPKAFQRNYGLRSVGSSKRVVIEDYIATQLDHHRMADARVQERLGDFQREYSGVNLSQPRLSSHGQYWYNLHVVLVNEGRWREIGDEALRGLLAMIERVAAKREHLLSRCAIQPDHLHLALGCPVDRSPAEIALC